MIIHKYIKLKIVKTFDTQLILKINIDDTNFAQKCFMIYFRFYLQVYFYLKNDKCEMKKKII